MSNYKWKAFFVTGLGTIMATLDASIVNVSLPTLNHELKAPLTTVAWVVMSYLLTITVLLLTIGRISDLISRKKVYLFGFAIFTIASVLCGISASVHLLIFYRVLQAIGAACLMANSPAVLADVFPPHERGKALGINGTIVAVGLTIGPPLGGFLIALWNWRLIFFINLPIGIIAMWAASRFLKENTPAKRVSFDYLGATIFTIGLLGLMLGITQGPNWGWQSLITRLLFGISIIDLIFFVWLELKIEHPMLDLSLFKNRLFASANFSAIINYASMYIYTILMPFFLKTIKGYNPEHMGLFMMVVPMTMSFISPLSGWLSDRMGSRLLSTSGLAVSGLSLILLSRLNGATSLPVIILSMMTLGIGSGLFQPPNTSAILGSVPKSRLGTASGMVATMRNLGMVTGVAIASGILTSRIQFYHTKYATLHLTASGMQYSSFIGAFSDTLIVGSFVCLIGVITSLNRGRTTPGKKANQDEKGICRSNTPE